MTGRRTINFGAACLFLIAALPLAYPVALRAGNMATPVEGAANLTLKGTVEPLPAGLFMNRRTEGQIVIYREGGEYWIPYRLFIAKTALVEVQGTEGRSSYRTSIGTLIFDKGELKVFENQPCISFASLGRSFMVTAGFDLQLFAAVLDIPWRPMIQQDGKTGAAIVPDVAAPTGSISFLSIEAGIQRNLRDISSNSLQLQAGGRVSTGVWDIDIEGDPEHQMEGRRWHWSTFNERLALRLGTGTNMLSPMTPDTAITGIQFGWDNRGILGCIDASARSATDQFVNPDSNLGRTIEGRGPAAGIAELRIDGRVVSRMRIRLDGRFAFENVRIGSDPRKTEVYVYERSTEEKPVALLDYTQTVMSGNLPGGELLVRGGAGSSGNPLETGRSGEEGRLSGYGQIRYGLNDRLTLDAAARYNPATAAGEFSAGTILSLSRDWAASIYETGAGKAFGTDLKIDGIGSRRNISWWSQWSQHGFGWQGAPQREQHWLRFTERPSDRLSLLVYGRQAREEGEWGTRYLLPGAYLTPMSGLRLGAVPNDEGHYRFEAIRSFSPSSTVSLLHEHGISTIEWDKHLMPNLGMRAFNEYAFVSGNELTGIYLDWFLHGSRMDLIEIGASRSGGEFGMSGKWNRYVNTGLRISLQYSWNMAQAQNLVTTSEYQGLAIPPGARHFVSCSVSLDLGFSGRRAFPIDRSAVSTTRGGIAGALKVDGDAKIQPSGINDVGILLDGRRLGQRQVNGSFFVGNLKPGNYTVTLDTERLPIELAAEKRKLLVEVRNGAVTNVDIPLHTLYGLSGRLYGADGNGLGSAEIEIVDERSLGVSTVSANQFGEYRAGGLPSGSYLLRAVSVSGRRLEHCPPRRVRIGREYLNGVDLRVDGSAEAGGAVAGSDASGSGSMN